MALFGKTGIFGRRAGQTFRAKVRDRSNGDFDSQGRYVFKTVEYPMALLRLRPGQTLSSAKQLLNTEAPDFNPDIYTLFPADYPFGYQFTREQTISNLSFGTDSLVDAITVAGIRTGCSLDEALSANSSLAAAVTRNQIEDKYGKFGLTYYRASGKELDLEVMVKNGIVVQIAMNLPGWAARQALEDLETLKRLQADDVRRQREDAWQSLKDSNERLSGWAQSRTSGDGKSNAWVWYANRLIESGPDAWHDAADQWNWDNGVEPLRWIANQAQCDKATALLIFHLAEPHYYAEKIAEGKEPSDQNVYHLLKNIREKWLAGYYSRSELAFDVSEHDDAPEAGDSDMDFVAASMRRSLRGRTPPSGLFFKDSPHRRDVFS